MRTSLLLTLLWLATLAGCTRSVPTELPRASAASPRGAAAPVARVGRALEEEPPLPGETPEGWEALDQGNRPAAAGHEGHVGHHAD